MKCRLDFVTNSSSSSYIIAFKSFPKIDEETLEKYPFLRGYSELIEKILLTSSDYNDTSDGEIYSTIEDFDKYFINNYGNRDDTIETICSEEEYCKEEYDNCKKYLDENYNILVKRVDYHDEYFPALIDEIGKNNSNFIIVEKGD